MQKKKNDLEGYEAWEAQVDNLRFRKGFWSQRAACNGLATEKLFPNSDVKQRVIANEVCRGCPVQMECLNFALVTKEEFGVWGGATEIQRSNMLSKLREHHRSIYRDWSEEIVNEIHDLVKAYVEKYNAEPILFAV